MKRLNRDMEAVSPVIATILMVAITVVLAATLYMMVGDIGGDDVQTLTGDITHNEDAEFEVVSISPNPDAEDVTVTLIGVDGAEWSIGPNGEDANWDDTVGDTEMTIDNVWSFLDGEEVQGGSRFDLSETDEWDDDTDEWQIGEDNDEDLDEVVLQVDGVDGTISYEM